VVTAGASLVRDFTARLKLGLETFAAVSDKFAIRRGLLQLQAGGNYELVEGFSLDFGIIRGFYGASPRVALQLGSRSTSRRWRSEAPVAVFSRVGQLHMVDHVRRASNLLSGGQGGPLLFAQHGEASPEIGKFQVIWCSGGTINALYSGMATRRARNPDRAVVPRERHQTGGRTAREILPPVLSDGPQVVGA
jgi:hypothetical protein